MPGGDGTHSSRRRRLPLPEILVVLVLVAAGLAYLTDLGDRLGVAAPDPLEEPAQVAPPDTVDLPSPAAARAVAAEARTSGLDPRAVRSAVAGLVGAKKLGRSFALEVTDVDGTSAYRIGPRVVTPASTTKLLTSTAVLDVLDDQHRFETVVRRQGRTLVLVGGGDPLLEPAPDPAADYPEARADLRTLAQQVARRLRADGPGGRLDLRYDTSLFAGPAVNPQWPDDYVTDGVVSPITSLWVDEGRDDDGFGRVADPARTAAKVFRSHLQRAGVRVGPPREGGSSGGGREVGRVESPPLVEIVQHVLEASDNEGAEVLLRHVALGSGRPGSFTAGVRAATDVLTELGVRMQGARWYDGSGLSRRDRLPVRTLVDVLVTALDRPPLERVVSGLPVAGYTGSLSDRFVIGSDAGLGRVRAKTGTLTGVSGLAGVIRGRDGSVMVYVAVADRVRPSNTLWVRARLDRISAALAACRCAAR